MLQLCISQTISDTPYTFKATGIRVYSIEEALYHAYHYWRESIDEILSENLTAWIESLGLLQITKKMKALSAITPSSKRLLAFLSIIEYFNTSELSALKTDLESWEHRVEWEKLKDRADNLVSRGEPAKALPLYRRALSYGENPALLNNMGIANMQLSNYQEAVNQLAKGHAAQPESTAIALHYAEALILNGDYEDANKTIQKAKGTYYTNTDGSKTTQSETADIQYLQGLMAYRQNDYPRALTHFQKAETLNPEAPLYTHKIAETYRQMHQYDKAIAALNQSQSAPHHVKAAEIYAEYGHAYNPEAIRHIRQAISEGGRGDASLWTKLAEYYRRDYDNQRASEAIIHALPGKSVPALLENARIKKGLGRMREYRTSLSDALKGLIERYREEQ
ncbi:MAG: tetratricopeptide repeat protein [Defluviitaleaceae bacterium]|nr:tetratricopeptide repeat protein [Defluviitaleaceae bacterium]